MSTSNGHGHRHRLVKRLLTGLATLILLGLAGLFGFNAYLSPIINGTVGTLNHNLTAARHSPLTKPELSRLQASQRQVDAQLCQAKASRPVQLPAVRASLDAALRTATQLDQDLAVKQKALGQQQGSASDKSGQTGQGTEKSGSSGQGNTSKDQDGQADQAKADQQAAAKARQKLDDLLRQNAAPPQGSTGKTGDQGQDGSGTDSVAKPW